MRLVIVALGLVVALAPGCGGKKRHVVIHPDEVGGRRSDGWRVASEPTRGPLPDAPAGTSPAADPAAGLQ